MDVIATMILKRRMKEYDVELGKQAIELERERGLRLAKEIEVLTLRKALIDEYKTCLAFGANIDSNTFMEILKGAFR